MCNSCQITQCGGLEKGFEFWCHCCFLLIRFASGDVVLLVFLHLCCWDIELQSCGSLRGILWRIIVVHGCRASLVVVIGLLFFFRLLWNQFWTFFDCPL